MNLNVLGAVFRRNFASYFASPTGYVFICVFVLLSGIAAFWPPEFFNANLANLNQLNLWFPFIMLVFIPAITMAVWADERRQGTDELLLTIPANDVDIVVGKYLAAVAVYTVSLLFSLVCNLIVLKILGNPDLGLFLGTYLGYWFIGLAMLAVGMVASFVTSNLTVGYILGGVFNAPLVFLVNADAIVPPPYALSVREWSIAERFYDFGRGVITLNGILYFLGLVVVMLYVGMILIGRRHWQGGRGGRLMGLHYLVRGLALAAAAVGISAIAQTHDARLDVTTERLSSLSAQTVELLSNLDAKRPVLVEAFVSPSVPETYVQQRLNLLAMLRELEARGGDKVKVTINNTERFTEEAARAEQRYNIIPRQVTTLNRGAMSVDHIFMGVAFSSGLKKVILPFIDRGIPVEYELVRSIATVTQQKQKRVGILQTDAQLYGQFNFQSMQSSGNWPIVDELEKQYEVVQVDPSQPITEKYDVLLAVQPSSLTQEQMDNFVAAVERGQPTAIFEDPFPIFAGDVPATSAPKRPPGGMQGMMMGMRQPPQPKGDINRLWRTLGVDFASEQIIAQRYNPYLKATQFPDEFVFVDEGEPGGKEPFNANDAITSQLQHMLFPFPGSVTKLNTSNLTFVPLVRTGDKNTGYVLYPDVLTQSPFGMGGGRLNERRLVVPTRTPYVLAAEIKGKIKQPQPMADEGKPAEKKAADAAKPADKATAAAKPADKAAKTAEKAKEPAAPPKPQEVELHVVVVADIDMLSRDFFRLREQGNVPEAGIHFDFDNVTFVLNTLDSLAGDNRFIEIRKRRPRHRILTTIEEKTTEAKQGALDARDRFMKEFKEGVAREKKALEDRIKDLKNRKNVNQLEMIQEVAMAEELGNQRVEATTQQLERKRDQEITKIETAQTLEIRKVQDRYKFWAVVLPPIPPLLVGLLVFLNRRAREREGVARSRLR